VPIPQSARKSTYLLIALWALLYGSFTLFRPPLLDDADSVHSEVAREMVVRHDWITLHANGIRYLEKAPLMYWSMALSFTFFGAEDWAARLPLALYTLALLLATNAFGRRLFASSGAGLYAAVILLTSFGIFLYTRIMIPDVIVCLWLTVSMWLFWASLEQEQPSRASAWGFQAAEKPVCGKRTVYSLGCSDSGHTSSCTSLVASARFSAACFAAACALNVLTKGLIGIVFPLAIAVLFLLFTRNLRHLLRWHPLSSALVFLAIALPWHIAAGVANPAQGHPSSVMPTQGNVHGFFWFYFVNEQYLRYLNRRVPRDYDTVPLALFWGLLVVWLMPWIAFLFKAFDKIPWKQAILRGPLDRRSQAWLLLGIWAVFVLLFFSFSTRQEYYVAPALPGLALLIGYWLARESEAPFSSSFARAGRRSALVLLVFGLVIAIAASVLAATTHAPAPGSDISDVLNANPDVYTLSLGHVLDLTTGAMAFFRGPLIGTSIAFLLGTLLNWLLRRRGKPVAANYALIAMMVVFIECAHLALCTFYPILGSKQFAVAITQRFHPGEAIVCDGEFANASSVRFYTSQRLLILNGRINGLWYGSLFPDSPDIFLDDARFNKLWAGPQRVYFVTGDDKKQASLAASATTYLLSKSGGRYLFSNRP
jgi:4-amino-4-deoxy-L-arabinose transferase-like glycosyltransferase